MSDRDQEAADAVLYGVADFGLILDADQIETVIDAYHDYLASKGPVIIDGGEVKAVERWTMPHDNGDGTRDVATYRVKDER